MQGRVLLTTLLLFHAILCAQDATVQVHVRLTSPDTRRVMNASGAVVWLTPVAPANTTSLRPGHFRVVQRGKQFAPHQLVVPVGSTVEFPNHDPFFHNVFSLFEGKRFDLGLYEAGGDRTVHFDRAGVSYIFCNIHSEMSAVVVALATPFYGISARSGQVSIPNVPAGKYVLRVWDEASSPDALNALTRQVDITGSTVSLGTLHLIDDGHLQLGHKNMYGQDYTTAAPASPAYRH